MWWWIGLVTFFLLIVGSFLLGVYLVIKKVGDKVAEVPKHIVKEGFLLLKDSLNKKKEHGK